MTESGCKHESVSVERSAPIQGTGRALSFEVAEIATAKALAKLGSEGWEMSGIVHGGNGEWVTFYLKRRLR